MLLVHDVAADDASVVVNYDGAVLALADGTDVALRHAGVVVGVSKLVEQLLLHIVAEYALIGDGAPDILILVNVNNRWHALNAHSRESLFHVTLEGLRLWVIDAVSCRRIDPQRAVECFLDAGNIAVGQRGAVLRVALEYFKHIAVISVEPCRGTKPDVAFAVF